MAEPPLLTTGTITLFLNVLLNVVVTVDVDIVMLPVMNCSLKTVHLRFTILVNGLPEDECSVHECGKLAPVH